MARPTLACPENPIEPYPIKLSGIVTKGFGRGSKELGIPTANLPEEVATSVTNLDTGIYFGYARVKGTNTFPMVMSFGWNPDYKNEKRSLEVHVIHQYDRDFYGEELSIVILGFIRPELNYTTKGFSS
jgi:riboflavin kinase